MTVGTERRRALIVPREHGAWGILLVPLVTGAAVGLRAASSPWELAPLVVAALGLFWLRTPVESWLGASPIRARSPEEFRLVKTAAFGLAAVSTASLAWLFLGGREWHLLWIGAAAAVAFAAQAIVRRIRRDARTAAQMVGAAGLTATAPAAYAAMTGRLDSMAWILWVANFWFAVNQIHYVHVRIHAAKIADRREKFTLGRGFLVGQLLLVLILVATCASEPVLRYAAWAFAPILYRGFAWFAERPSPLAVRSLGKSELAHACVFGLLLSLAIAWR